MSEQILVTSRIYDKGQPIGFIRNFVLMMVYYVLLVNDSEYW